jgi:hypothetical protein
MADIGLEPVGDDLYIRTTSLGLQEIHPPGLKSLDKVLHDGMAVHRTAGKNIQGGITFFYPRVQADVGFFEEKKAGDTPGRELMKMGVVNGGSTCSGRLKQNCLQGMYVFE